MLRQLGPAPVAVVAVAGLYRTGKSFLLNQLVAANTDGPPDPARAAMPSEQTPPPEGGGEGGSGGGDGGDGGGGGGGFTIGHDTESCTRGIWVKLVPSSVWPAGQEHAGPSAERVQAAAPRLLLMDSEGLASVDQVLALAPRCMPSAHNRGLSSALT